MPDPHALPDHVAQLISKGRLVEAIRELREQRGLGLKEAKALVERMGSMRAPQPQVQEPMRAAPPLPPEVAHSLYAGNRMEAIRLYRQRTRVGLKEAKDAVDSLAQQLGSPGIGLAPGEVPRSRGVAWLIGAVLAAVLLLYLFWR